MNVKDEDGQWS